LKAVAYGTRMSMISLQLLPMFESKEWLARVHTSTHFCLAWTQPLRLQINPLLHAHRVGLGSGDIEIAMLSGALYSFIGLFASTQLSKLIVAMRSFIKISQLYKQETMATIQRPSMQCALNFSTPTANPSVLTGEVLVEDEYLQQAKTSSNKSFLPIFLLYKILVTSWFHDYRAGEKAIKAIHKCNLDCFSAPNFILLYLHQGLICAALARGGDRSRIRTTRSCLKKLHFYASYCSANVMSKIRLLEAEVCVYEIKIDEAMTKYDEAWHLAHNEELWNECGLICECASRALVYAGRTSEANYMLQKAIAAYQEWGATTKVLVDLLTQQLSR
jgi:hypothetical protein